MSCNDAATSRSTNAWCGDRNPFAGRNFVTDEVLALLKTPQGYIIEVSTGMFLGERLFGFTTNDPHRESRCCHSWKRVAALRAGRRRPRPGRRGRAAASRARTESVLLAEGTLSDGS